MTRAWEDSPSTRSPRIATCLHGIPTVSQTGLALHDAEVDVWDSVMAEIAGAGFTAVELSDGHLRVGDADPVRLGEIVEAAKARDVAIVSVHVQRRSILQPGEEQANLDYAHRAIEAAAACGIEVFSTGLHQPLNSAQSSALWFWTAQGPRDSTDVDTWNRAVGGFRELGLHAAELGLRVSLELYEDTLLGTAESAVRLIEDIGLPNVGLNPDVGNLIRLHRPVEDWWEVYARTLPYANYWHLKNYARDEAADGSWYMATPTNLRLGLINYRRVVAEAQRIGYDGLFVMEQYGGDSIGVCRENAEYIGSLLESRQ